MITRNIKFIASRQFSRVWPRGRDIMMPGRGTGLRPMPGRRHTRGCSGHDAFLLTEAVVAMAILVLAVFPLSYAVWREHQLSRACYYRAVAIELVDGEMEVLAAGDGRRLAEGSHPYTVRAESVTNLPPGRFVVTRTGKQLRLEWQPAKRDKGGSVSREATLP